MTQSGIGFVPRVAKIMPKSPLAPAARVFSCPNREKPMIKIVMSLAVAGFVLAGCGSPVYYCETEFGQQPPLVNDEGVKYWPGWCFPQDRYDLEDERPGSIYP